MMEDLIAELTPILVQLFIAVITFVTGWLATKVAAYLREKTWGRVVEETVTWAVTCVEQLYLAGKLDGGVAKFNEAKKRALEILNARKIPITEAELDTLIEAVVHNWFPKEPQE